jgi:hypothetical protein
MTPKVKEVLDKIIERFERGDIPEAIAFSMFPIPDLPCSKWSLINRTLVFLAGSMDARGFRQWNSVNRSVKKGTKAIYIQVPYFKKDKEEEDKQKLMGFGASPVFKVEDTDGEPLDYQKINLPELPFIERANEWGISVKAIPGNYSYYGYYSANRKEISLATSEENVFFHELAHAAHHRLQGQMKRGQDPLQEIVAELSASALAMMAGREIDKSIGHSYQYISEYAEKLNLGPHAACLKVLAETEKVLNLIVKNGADNIEKQGV